jgi:NADPH-dependent curcumin reductase CurA
MAPLTNTRVLFNEIPTGYPEPGKATVVDKSESIDLDTTLPNGGVLVKILVLSIDPYQRGRMRDEKIWSYMVSHPDTLSSLVFS